MKKLYMPTIEDKIYELYPELLIKEIKEEKIKTHDIIFGGLNAHFKKDEEKNRIEDKALQLFQMLVDVYGFSKALSIMQENYNPQPLISRLLPDPRMPKTAGVLEDDHELIKAFFKHPIKHTSYIKDLESLSAAIDAATAQSAAPIEEIVPDAQPSPAPVPSQEKTSPSMMFKTREQHEQQAARAAEKEQQFHLVLRLRPNKSAE